MANKNNENNIEVIATHLQMAGDEFEESFVLCTSVFEKITSTSKDFMQILTAFMTTKCDFHFILSAIIQYFKKWPG